MTSDPSPIERRHVLIGLGSGLAASLAGCASDGSDGGTTPTATEGDMETPTERDADTPTETPPGMAMVRVAHLSPAAPNVDVSVDGAVVLEDVPFGAVSGYLQVAAGEHDVEITAAGDADTAVFADTLTLEGEAAYTVAAAGELGDDADRSFEPLVLADDISAPDEGMARLRLLHASPDAPAVDVTLASTGDALYDGVSFGGADTVTVPAGEYTIQVRGDTDGSDGEVVASYDIALDGGQVYSAFAVGYLTPEDEPGEPPFELLVSNDSTGDVAPAPPAQSRLRVAHLSPNAPNVDVSVDGSLVLEDVPFGAVSAYLEVPPGERDVEITPAGDAETAVFDGAVSVHAAAAYTVAAIGELGEEADAAFEPLILADDLSAPGDGNARLSAVHVSPDAPAVDITVASTGDALFDGVPYGKRGSIEVPAGDYTVQIRGDTDGNDGEVVADFDVSLAAGDAYTAFAAGYLTPDDEPAATPFDLVLSRDSNGQ